MSTEKLAKEISELLPIFLRNMYPFVFNPMPVPPSQVLAICSIDEAGGCTLTELKKMMHVSAPTITGIVDRLERDGYITRHISKEDRRVKIVKLTQKGQNLIKKFRANVKKRWEYILSKMPEQMGATQVQIMRRITSGFKDGSI